MNLQKRHDLRRSPDWLVWRGQDAAGRLVTVKEINPESPYPQPLADRLAAEYRFLAGLDHPNVLAAVSPDPSGRRAVFADAQCNLAQYLAASGPMAPPDVANVLVQAAAALDHLHGRRKGHGCVNAFTLLVGPRGDVLVGDFLGYDLTGTASPPVPDPEPRYQAPELIDSTFGKCGPPADLYCLGFAGLELLAGDRFEGLFALPDGANWLAWHADPGRKLADWRGALGHVPTGLLDILEGLIAKRPGERTFQTAAQLKAALVRSRLTSEKRLAVYRPSAAPPRPKVVEQSPSAPPRRDRKAPPTAPTRRPTLVLRPLNADGGGREFPPRRPVLVGRSRGCDLTLSARVVSPKHAVLACGPDGVWRAYDLKSTAGTFVNGAKRPKARLYAGDEVYFAGVGYAVDLDDRVPRRAFDQFELHEVLHRGRQGRVYRATWVERRNRQVAVRVFDQGFQHDDTAIKRFLRAVPPAARLRHPNLVRLYRGGVEPVRNNRAWFLATEYLPGGSLRDRLRRHGRLPAAEALRVARDVTTGLAALAEVGWAHRNVTPGGVLFTADGSAKLGDYGLLRPSAGGAGVTASSAADAGELVYRAPEGPGADGDWPATADLYSLGVVLYEALTGRPPFPVDAPLPELVAAIHRGGVPPASDVDPAVPVPVARLVARLMAADPAERYGSAEEALAAVAKAEKVLARHRHTALAGT